MESEDLQFTTRQAKLARIAAQGFILLLLVQGILGCGPSTKPASANPPMDIQALRMKAEQGEAGAQAQLGRLYVKGEGVTNDYQEAAKWFQRSAEKGNADGQLGLGELYEAGQGVKQDLTEALRRYHLAAEQGHPGAQYALGFLYEAGRGVPQNQVEAAKWFRLAAEQGDPLSQYDLGQRYELGVGVSVDRAEALKWFTLASNQGQADAAARRDQLRKRLTSAEIAEAQRRLTAFSQPSPRKPGVLSPR